MSSGGVDRVPVISHQMGPSLLPSDPFGASRHRYRGLNEFMSDRSLNSDLERSSLPRDRSRVVRWEESSGKGDTGTSLVDAPGREEELGSPSPLFPRRRDRGPSSGGIPLDEISRVSSSLPRLESPCSHRSTMSSTTSSSEADDLSSSSSSLDGVRRVERISHREDDLIRRLEILSVQVERLTTSEEALNQEMIQELRGFHEYLYILPDSIREEVALCPAFRGDFLHMRVENAAARDPVTDLLPTRTFIEVLRQAQEVVYRETTLLGRDAQLPSQLAFGDSLVRELRQLLTRIESLDDRDTRYVRELRRLQEQITEAESDLARIRSLSHTATMRIYSEARNVNRERIDSLVEELSRLKVKHEEMWKELYDRELHIRVLKSMREDESTRDVLESSSLIQPQHDQSRSYDDYRSLLPKTEQELRHAHISALRQNRVHLLDSSLGREEQIRDTLSEDLLALRDHICKLESEVHHLRGKPYYSFAES